MGGKASVAKSPPRATGHSRTSALPAKRPDHPASRTSHGPVDGYAGTVEPSDIPDRKTMHRAVRGSGHGDGKKGHHEEGGHDGVIQVTHGVHQAKGVVHSAHRVAEVAEEAQAAAREARAATAVVKAAEASSDLPKDVQQAVSRLSDQGLTGAQAEGLTRATQVLSEYRGLQKQATRASLRQSQLARRLNRALVEGKSTPQQIQKLRADLVQATREANKAHERLRKAAEEARRARQQIRQIGAEVEEAKANAPLLRKALRLVADTRAGRATAQAARRAANSRLARVAAALEQSKLVRVGGKVLVVGAVGLDAYLATRKDATVIGNATRATGQAAASAALYTTPQLLPVLVAEAFLMDKPHLTGPVRAAVQVVGVAADGLSGGSDQAYRSLARLDREMKEGKYGGFIKGANYFGQSLADEGVSGVAREAVHYWKNATPKKVWRDIREIASWLFE